MKLTEKTLFYGLFLIPLLAWPWSNDPFLMPKLALLVPLGLFMLTIAIWQIWNLQGKLFRTTLGLTFLFLALMTSSLLLTPGNLTEKFYGYFTRNNGFLTYLSLLGLFLTGYLHANKINLVKLSKYAKLMTVLVLFIGFLQKFKINITSLNPNNLVIGFFGNVNFQSAFLGMMSTFFIYEVYKKNNKYSVKVFNFIVSVLIIIQILNTKSIQGLFLFSINLIVMTFFFLRSNNKNNYLKVFSLIILVSSIFSAFGIFNKGPLANYLFDLSTIDRGYCSEAGLRMAQQNPLIGVGFDQYRYYYRQFRSETAIEFQNTNFNHICDTAHNVYIDIAANNGFLVALIYILVVLATLKKVFQIARYTEKFDAVIFTFIGLWIGYQVQSLISINHIGIAIWGWAVTGILLGYNGKTSYSSAGIDKPIYKIPKMKYLVLTFGISAVIIMPLVLKYNSFYLAQYENTNKQLVKVSLQNPLMMPFLYAAAKNASEMGDNGTALKLGLIASREFPNSTDAWQLLINNPLASQSEILNAKINLKRLGSG